MERDRQIRQALLTLSDPRLAAGDFT